MPPDKPSQMRTQSSRGGGGGPPPLGTGRRMEGIGNPMFSDPRLEPEPKSKMEAMMKEVGETVVGMIKDPLARGADARIANAHGEMPRPGGMQGFGSHSNAGTVGSILFTFYENVVMR